MLFSAAMKIRSRYKNFEIAIDEKIIRDRFQRELENRHGKRIHMSDFFVTRVFPRREGGFTIQYELYLQEPGSSEAEKMILCGNLLEPGGSHPDYIDKPGAEYFMFKDIGLIIPVFPFDPKLKSLKELAQVQKGSTIYGILDKLFDGGIERVNFEILAYRLEKRCVLRYSVENMNGASDRSTVVAKVSRFSAFDKVLDLSSRLKNGGFGRRYSDGITIPCILDHNRDLGAIFMENAPGISLHFLIDRDIFTEACSASGRVLRKLHKLDTTDLQIYTKGDELGNLIGLQELIKDMYPEFIDDLRRNLGDLSDRKPEATKEPVFTHRDYFDKQLLYSEFGTTLLDYGNAALADPALDAGNFIAHLILRKLQHPDCGPNIDKGIDAFIESYGEFDELFEERSKWWIRASLLRLFALYLLRPRWRNMAADLITEPLNFLEKR
jgi:thiamine kinase-like enzyme